MNWNEFKFESSLENSLLKIIEHHLQISIKSQGFAKLLLSGGSFPMKLFRKFKLFLIDWNKSQSGLSIYELFTLISNRVIRQYI